MEVQTHGRLHPDDLAAIVQAVRVQTPWLTAHEAAAYLGCSLSRVRRLTMTRELPHEKDGARVLYHRDALDKFILAGGARTP
jgi:excisionase family DNA binding protein